jgi:hypothetical protein
MNRQLRGDPVDVRFFRWVVAGPNDCWVWAGKTNDEGYARLDLGSRSRNNPTRRSVYVHRWSYEFHVGPIPEGLTVDHRCRNKRCVNPAHLEAVTTGENTRRHTRLITHCPHGHLYDEANTRVSKDGKRACRTCDRARAAQRRNRAA